MYNLTHHEFDDRDLENVIRLFRSTRLTMGDNVKKFERDIAEFHGREYGVMVNSGSSANLVLFSSLVTTGRLKTGDRVLVPAVSWSTTFFPILQCGLIPVFVDVSFDTWTLTSEILNDALDRKPEIKAVFFVSLLGSFTDFGSIKNLCDDRDIILLVDNCEGFGSKECEASLDLAGGGSKAMTLSFFYSHQLPAIEGGMILTNDEEVFHHMLAIRAHGWTRDLPSAKFLPIDESEFTSLFRFVLPGYCLRPMEINAVLGLERLQRWPDVFSTRTGNLITFEKIFSPIEQISIQKLYRGQSAFGFGMLMPSNSVRERLIQLCGKSGIQCRPIVAGNFLRNPVCQRIPFDSVGNFLVADYIDECGIFFGNSNTDLSQQLVRLQELVISVVQ